MSGASSLLVDTSLHAVGLSGVKPPYLRGLRRIWFLLSNTLGISIRTGKGPLVSIMVLCRG